MPVPVGKIIDRAETLGREIGRVVVDHLIVVNPHMAATLAGQIRQVKDTYSAGVMSGDILVGINVFGVLNFITIYVVFGTIAP